MITNWNKEELSQRKRKILKFYPRAIHSYAKTK